MNDHPAHIPVRVTLGTLAALGAKAQPGKTFRVGFLTAYSRNADAPLFDSFRQGMLELGYEEGRNIAYQTRWAEGRLERLPGLAAELVALKLDTMLVASSLRLGAACLPCMPSGSSPTQAG